MEEKLSVKTNAVELLDKELHNRAKKGQYGFIVLSSATDPYLHFEKDLGLTRQILEVILKHRFPVHIITRSDLVIRDLDLLRKINKNAILPQDMEGKLAHKVFITFSFSTLEVTLYHTFVIRIGKAIFSITGKDGNKPDSINRFYFSILYF